MTYRRAIREWAADAAKAVKGAAHWTEVTLALAMMAVASFAGASAARWVFGP